MGWAAPTILSATPASAGAASGDPCTPTVVATSECVEGVALRYSYSISIDPQVCPGGAVVEGFRSVDGGPFNYVVCTELTPAQPTLSIGEIPFQDNVTGQVRWDWKTKPAQNFCAGTVIQSFLSPVFGPCQIP